MDVRRLFTALVMLASVSRAQAETNDDLQKIVESQPGAEIKIVVNPDGTESKDVRLPSGVRYLFDRTKNGVNAIGIDETGHGAVMCAWSIYVELAAVWDACPTNESREPRESLSEAIDRIDEFVVTNSLTPVTRAELSDRESQVISDYASRAAHMPKDKLEKACISVHTAKMLAFMKTSTKMNDDVTKLLSLPRPPVTNPCL